MYLPIKRTSGSKTRGRAARLRAKLKAKNRRRVNRMAGRRASAKGFPNRG